MESSASATLIHTLEENWQTEMLGFYTYQSLAGAERTLNAGMSFEGLAAAERQLVLRRPAVPDGSRQRHILSLPIVSASAEALPSAKNFHQNFNSLQILKFIATKPMLFGHFNLAER